MTFPILTATGTERVIDVAALAVPLVCICFGQKTQAGAEAVEVAVREHYPAASDVLIAHVVDLRSVPSMFHGVARGILKSEYDKAVASLPEGQTPYEDVIILPDWDGAFIDTLSLTSSVDELLAVAVFAPAGNLIGTGHGEEAANEALALLRDV